MKPVVLVDVDGVVADFIGGFVRVVNQVTGRSHLPEEVTTWDIFESIEVSDLEKMQVYDRILSFGFCEGLHEHASAVEAVKRMHEFANVVFVTSPYSHHRTWTYERDRWLGRRFVKPTVIHTDHKHHVRGDFFIDDKPSHVKRWSAAHPTGSAFLWGDRLDPEGLERVTDWNVVVAAIADAWASDYIAIAGKR